MSTRGKIIIVLIVAIVFLIAVTPEQEVPKVVSNPTYVSSIDLATPAPKPDTVLAKKLRPSFVFKKDEFSGDTWIRHKSFPQYVNINAIGVYFMNSSTGVGPLRLKIQYLADDWLFIESMIFLIDGQSYRYTPMKVERDNEDGDIWEWSDEAADSEITDIILALAGAKSAKVKFLGQQYSDVKVISAARLRGIKETLKLYQAMGGVLK